MWVTWRILPSITSLCSWFADWNRQSRIHTSHCLHDIPWLSQSHLKSTYQDLSSWSPPPNLILSRDSLQWMNHHPSSFTSQKPRCHPCYFFLPPHIQSIMWVCLLTLLHLHHHLTWVLFNYHRLPTDVATSTPAPNNMSSIPHLEWLFFKKAQIWYFPPA